MDEKNIGMFFGYLFSFIFIAIIGMTFSAYIHKDQAVMVETMYFQVEDGIIVQKYGKDKPISKTKFKSSQIGIKLISGELDTQTDIPYTVTSKIGSEGSYVKFQIVSSKNFEIVLSSSTGVPENELENVKISVEKSGFKSIGLNEINSVIAKGNSNTKAKKFVVLVWLDQHVGKKIIGSKICINLFIRQAT